MPPSEGANKTPLPPAMAGTIVGQPPRKRLKLDDDPFGAVGDYAGSFLIKSAVEALRRLRHQSRAHVRAARTAGLRHRAGISGGLRLGASRAGRRSPRLLQRLCRQSAGDNRRPAQLGAIDVDRPDFTGHIDGRLDVTRDTRLTAQARLRVSTDNPGSPNIQAGLARYPIYTTLGGTLGFDQSFNRLDIAAGATVDRTDYTNSKLTDGSTASNDDRNFSQYGGVGRISYDLTPGVKPFVEAEGDSRVHDLAFDRSGFQRDSTGGYAKAGTSFEFSRLLTGEIAIGYAARNYVDPRLEPLQGLLTSASLIWTATPLTTARFYSDTQIAETTLPLTSGVLVHTYTFEVDHDFRRWLAAVGKFTYGTYDYQGDIRNDKTYSLEGDLIYKLNRNFWIKGTLRHDILDSNVPLASSNATVVMLGVRVQN